MPQNPTLEEWRLLTLRPLDRFPAFRCHSFGSP